MTTPSTADLIDAVGAHANHGTFAGGTENERCSWNVRAMLEANAIPFATAEYERRAAIFRQGDPSDNVLHLEDGAVLLAVSTPSGKEAICGVLGVGAFLGEEALMGHAVRRHSAIALTDTKVLVIAKAHWLRLLHTEPAITDRFIEHLIVRETRLEEDLTDQLLHPAQQRLARTLLVLAGCDPWRPCRCALPDISQGLIAEIVGTTRSRVNTFIGKFKRVGFVEEDNGRLFVRTSRLPIVCGVSRGVAPPGRSRRAVREHARRQESFGSELRECRGGAAGC